MIIKNINDLDITNFKNDLYENVIDREKISKSDKFIDNNISLLTNVSNNGYYVCLEPDMAPVAYKKSSKSIRIIHRTRPHLILLNSIIKNILMINDNINKSINLATYLLYLFWIYKKDKLSTIVNNVCIDIEDIISIIINKSYTKYRDYDTMSIVEALRSKLDCERVYEIGASI